MTVEPITHTVHVKVAPERAFELFTRHIGRWWPKGKTIAPNPHADIVLEPAPGGRWFERDADGAETQWGTVLAWDPPSRLRLGWEINAAFRHDRAAQSEVEITFAPVAGGTEVRLVHRHLEVLGVEAERVAALIRSGWPSRMADYTAFVEAVASPGSPSGDLVVHSIPGSPFGRAVLATLEEKRIPYRLEAMAPGSLKAPPHLARHAFGRIPVIEHGDFTLYESQAILRYLDRLWPTPPLTPADPRAAARMDQVMNISDWYLFQGGGAVIGFQRVVGPRLLGLACDEAVVADALPRVQHVFGELARLLGDQPYFAGDSISLADFHIVPLIDFLAETPEWAALTEGRPNLVAWHERVTARPSLTATTWDRVAGMARAA